MPNKRFNPTRAAVRVWYIMSTVGTRGLTWALGIMDSEARIVTNLRIVTILLEDVAATVRHGNVVAPRTIFRAIAEAVVSLHEIKEYIFDIRPELNYYRNIVAPGGPSSDFQAHARVAATLASTYLLVAEGSIDKAKAQLVKHLEHETSEFHKGWLAYEIDALNKTFTDQK